MADGLQAVMCSCCLCLDRCKVVGPKLCLLLGLVQFPSLYEAGNADTGLTTESCIYCVGATHKAREQACIMGKVVVCIKKLYCVVDCWGCCELSIYEARVHACSKTATLLAKERYHSQDTGFSKEFMYSAAQ